MNISNFTKDEVGRWEIENDGVMGGVSQSEISHIEKDGSDWMKFSGHVSLKNGGGFAQTQCTYENYLDLSPFNQIKISGSGDGKTYTLRFETDEDGVSYESEFVAQNSFKEHISLDGLKKIFHGEPVPNKPDFDKSKVKRLCILIGNGVEEDFEIKIDSIDAVA